jgi:hypothetical protein
VLDFVDEYWKIVSEGQDTQAIRQNKHFVPLTNFLKQSIGGGISEYRMPVRFRKYKKWDLVFPHLKVAIEYKSITSKSIQKCKYLRIEEALGSAIDVKYREKDYKLGFILLFAFPTYDNNILKSRNYMIKTFDLMVKDGLYDFFCPIQTSGMTNHIELSENYSLPKFINDVKKAEYHGSF